MNSETIYILRRSDGSFYISDFSSIIEDETEAKETLKDLQDSGIANSGWSIEIFKKVHVTTGGTQFLGVDGGLRERTLKAIAEDNRAAVAWQKINPGN